MQSMNGLIVTSSPVQSIAALWPFQERMSSFRADDVGKEWLRISWMSNVRGVKIIAGISSRTKYSSLT
jgi:hypothetical protein